MYFDFILFQIYPKVIHFIKTILQRFNNYVLEHFFIFGSLNLQLQIHKIYLKSNFLNIVGVHLLFLS